MKNVLGGQGDLYFRDSLTNLHKVSGLVFMPNHIVKLVL